MVRIIIAITAFVIAGAVFFWYTKPAYDSTKILQEEIAQFDQALERANELQALRQQLLSRFNAFNPADVERLSKLLPDHVDNVRLILDLDNLAARFGLAIQNVVVGEGGGRSSGEAAATIIAQGDRQYDSLTLSFTTYGSYETFIQLIESLEQSLRIVDLIALSVAAAPGPQGQQTYRFDVTIRTYWLR